MRLLGSKISGSWRFYEVMLAVLGDGKRDSHRLPLTVIIRVFEGGDGSTRGGRLERSRESGDFEPEDARERAGEGIMAVMCRGSGVGGVQ